MNIANKHIQTLGTYKPPLEGRENYTGLLLDFNERTIPPGPKILAAAAAYVQENRFQRYPEYGNITEKVAEYVGVKPGEILMTNGSDQGIDVIFRTFTEKNDRVIIPEPSFAMFYQSAGTIGNEIVMPEYQWPEMAYPFEDVLNNINQKTKLIVVCNPNNPTGTLTNLEQIGEIAKAAPESIILVDEAYYEFSGLTAVPLIKKYSNIVITRTFSKAFGLVAFRIGYVVAQEGVINELMKVRSPYDVNKIAIRVAHAALEDVADMKKYSDEVMSKAKPLVEQLFTAKKIPFVKSFSNFIFFKPENSESLYQQLLERGIRIRVRDKGMLRATIGTVDQMKQFINIFNTLTL